MDVVVRIPILSIALQVIGDSGQYVFEVESMTTVVADAIEDTKRDGVVLQTAVYLLGKVTARLPSALHSCDLLLVFVDSPLRFAVLDGRLGLQLVVVVLCRDQLLEHLAWNPQCIPESLPREDRYVDSGDHRQAGTLMKRCRK